MAQGTRQYSVVACMGKESKKSVYTHECIIDSFSCTPETNTL